MDRNPVAGIGAWAFAGRGATEDLTRLGRLNLAKAGIVATKNTKN